MNYRVWHIFIEKGILLPVYPSSSLLHIVFFFLRNVSQGLTIWTILVILFYFLLVLSYSLPFPRLLFVFFHVNTSYNHMYCIVLTTCKLSLWSIVGFNVILTFKQLMLYIFVWMCFSSIFMTKYMKHNALYMVYLTFFHQLLFVAHFLWQ